MDVNKIFDVFGAIVTVALVATIVQSTESAKIVTAIGSAFSGSLKAAKG